MNIFELLAIAIGLSMDAFAVAISLGLTMVKVNMKKSLTIGLYFGIFQAVMPLFGYLLGKQFADQITALDHWIAFILLCFIGGKMIIESIKKIGCPDRECPAKTCIDRKCPYGERPEVKEASLKPLKMLPLAIATSIDALAVGISFAFLKVNMFSAVLSIGFTTLTLSMIGVIIGNIFGTRFKSKAEFAGGVILALMGFKILLEHMGFINF